MSRNRLGRGLDSLIAAAGPFTGEEVRSVPTDRLEPNPFQPRRNFDEQALAELAQSIEENGILQPIIVRPRGESYQIVVGERRWRACRKLELCEVPVICREVNDRSMLEQALIENVQREDLDPIETARAFERLVSDLGLTHEQTARRVGKKRSSVTNMIRLLELPAEVQEAVSRGTISMGHARSLLSLESDAERARALALVLSRGLTVRQTENLVGRLKSGEQPDIDASATPGNGTRRDPVIADLEDRLRRRLSARVTIAPRGKGGRIVIEFADHEQFDRILDVIGA